MKVLKVIHDQEPSKHNGYHERRTVRAVLMDDDGLTPLIFVTKYNFHTLPGGRLEKDEADNQALMREIKEETGCEMKIIRLIGRVVEYRALQKAKRISDCYLGEITQKGTSDFTQGEISEGSQLVWKDINEAIQTIEMDEPNIYKGLFIQQRDLVFLKEACRLIQAQKQKTDLKPKSGTKRANIKPGLKVTIVLKKDQPTGKLTTGVVKDLLTSSSEHHRGIKVRLQDGQVGRVQQILN